MPERGFAPGISASISGKKSSPHGKRMVGDSEFAPTAQDCKTVPVADEKTPTVKVINNLARFGTAVYLPGGAQADRVG